MFSDLHLNREKPVYLQIKDYIRQLVVSGLLHKGQKLPSTRELGTLLGVSRNTVIASYAYLEDEGLITIIKGSGAFVSGPAANSGEVWNLEWSGRVNRYARTAEELDIIKHGVTWEKGTISFTSIAPDVSLFDLDGFKRAFLNRMTLEGDRLLGYGYAKGYKPLIQYLMKYMESKGVDLDGKDILITNGFTDGFDILLSALACKGSRIICENPTHNTALKIMQLHGLRITGIDMENDGVDTGKLKAALSSEAADLAYLVPSYHNPTGIVMSPEKRMEVLKILKDFKVPVIEDGFNEELRYSGSHLSPLAACCKAGNSVVYTGSFSKILFPGLRIGWILADRELIGFLESVKRSRSIHVSFLDQAVLYQYFQEGNFEKYLKRARKVYREKYELALKCAKAFIPCKRISGEGGLHIFIELDGISAHDVLVICREKGVVFTPGDIFFTDGGGQNTLRLGFARNDGGSIQKGFKIIGDVIKSLEGMQ